ncbi:MAG: hypothetical protein ACREUY_07095, partial [Burkholderiales bacterium]
IRLCLRDGFFGVQIAGSRFPPPKNNFKIMKKYVVFSKIIGIELAHQASVIVLSSKFERNIGADRLMPVLRECGATPRTK